MLNYNKQELLSTSNKIITVYQKIISEEKVIESLKEKILDNMVLISELIKTSMYIDSEGEEIKKDFYNLYNEIISETITSISVMEFND